MRQPTRILSSLLALCLVADPALAAAIPLAQTIPVYSPSCDPAFSVEALAPLQTHFGDPSSANAPVTVRQWSREAGLTRREVVVGGAATVAVVAIVELFSRLFRHPNVIGQALGPMTTNSDLWVVSPNPDQPQPDGGTIVDQVLRASNNSILWIWFNDPAWTGWGLMYWADGHQAIDAARHGLANTYLKLDLGLIDTFDGSFDIVLEDNQAVHLNGNAWVGNEVGMKWDDPRVHRQMRVYGRDLVSGKDANAYTLYISLEDVKKANPAIDLTHLKPPKFRAQSPGGQVEFHDISVIHDPSGLPAGGSDSAPMQAPGMNRRGFFQRSLPSRIPIFQMAA